jgi:hypothetical protein
MKPRNINWNNVDWTKKNSQIAQALGLTNSAVSYYKRKMHSRRLARAKHLIDWSNVDWSKPNYIIAENKLATPPAVATARARFAPAEFKNSPISRGRRLNKAAVTKPESTEAKAVATVITPQPVKMQPGIVKRALIKVRDWLFNLCVSVEKEAGK